ncbi:MAG: hypothetical protein GXP61_10170 [Epsilonproteobacteria bacterium]|nr:hypothetical protein [Campylobacterota bacterium]
MIKIILVLLFCYNLSFAYTKNNIIDDYKNQKYKKVCIYGTVSNSKDESILSLIASACLKIDSINPLGILIKKMVTTPKYRENASYFATILLQKKLIYQFMIDDIDLSGIRLPRTSYVLSIVFENLVKKNYKVIGNKIKITLKNKTYMIWHSNKKPIKIFIDEYKDGILLKTHWYL